MPNTMITIETENYNYISQDFYNKTIHSINLNQVSCTCGLSGSLTFYGSYKRKVQLRDKVLILTVARVSCSACGHTHALLLSSIIPYSQIPVAVQADTIIAMEEGNSMDTILEEQCYVDESNIRYIIRIYHLHWKGRLLSEDILVPPIPLLIRKCFSCFSRSFMQIKTTRNKLFPQKLKRSTCGNPGIHRNFISTELSFIYKRIRSFDRECRERQDTCHP